MGNLQPKSNPTASDAIFFENKHIGVLLWCPSKSSNEWHTHLIKTEEEY